MMDLGLGQWLRQVTGSTAPGLLSVGAHAIREREKIIWGVRKVKGSPENSRVCSADSKEQVLKEVQRHSGVGKGLSTGATLKGLPGVT